MKFSALKAAVAQDEEGAVVTIEDKTGEPYLAADHSPATITVVGSESSRFRAAKDRLNKKAVRDRRSKLTPAELHANRVELAAAAVTEWHGWEDEEGQGIPCTPENVRELLAAAEHVLEQVEVGIHRHASFFGTSSAA